jgi:hypothetical protein
MTIFFIALLAIVLIYPELIVYPIIGLCYFLYYFLFGKLDDKPASPAQPPRPPTAI